MNEESKNENSIYKIIFKINLYGDVSGILFPYNYIINTLNIDKSVNNSINKTNEINLPRFKKITNKNIKNYINNNLNIINLQKEGKSIQKEKKSIQKEKFNQKKI